MCSTDPSSLGCSLEVELNRTRILTLVANEQESKCYVYGNVGGLSICLRLLVGEPLRLSGALI